MLCCKRGLSDRGYSCLFDAFFDRSGSLLSTFVQSMLGVDRFLQ